MFSGKFDKSKSKNNSKTSIANFSGKSKHKMLFTQYSDKFGTLLCKFA